MRRQKIQEPQMILGWREWATMPEIGIEAVHAKLDTGARSSALHVVDMETFQRLDQEWIRFWVDPDPRRPDFIVKCEALVADERFVKNSGGKRQMRVVIRTGLEIAGRSWPIDLTLTGRSQMRFRMLIGREAMRNRILVDPTRSDLAGTLAGSRSSRKVKKTT